MTTDIRLAIRQKAVTHSTVVPIPSLSGENIRKLPFPWALGSVPATDGCSRRAVPGSVTGPLPRVTCHIGRSSGPDVPSKRSEIGRPDWSRARCIYGPKWWVPLQGIGVEKLSGFDPTGGLGLRELDSYNAVAFDILILNKRL